MRTRGLIALAALALVGCQAGTTHGFRVDQPEGWSDATDTAETKTGGEFEVVYEGPPAEGVTASIAVARADLPADVGLTSAVERARRIVDTQLRANPGPAVADRLGGEPALRFDYQAGRKRARRLSAVHAGRLYAITLESAPETFERNLAVLRRLTASWRWE